MTDALRRSNVNLIDNGKLLLDVDSSLVDVTFITNNYIDVVKSNILDSLTTNIDETNLKIFLTHQPRKYLIDKAVESNYDLFLAGHTHGGQFTFLFPFKNISPSRFETKYVRGDFWFGKTLAIVNRGLGMSIFPLRYNSSSEVTIINVVRA